MGKYGWKYSGYFSRLRIINLKNQTCTFVSLVHNRTVRRPLNQPTNDSNLKETCAASRWIFFLYAHSLKSNVRQTCAGWACSSVSPSAVVVVVDVVVGAGSRSVMSNLISTLQPDQRGLVRLRQVSWLRWQKDYPWPRGRRFNPSYHQIFFSSKCLSRLCTPRARWSCQMLLRYFRLKLDQIWEWQF